MINFACVNYGTKYKPTYVQNLYNMVKRHLTVPHKFICFTDQPYVRKQIKGDVEFRQFKKHNLKGYWNKLQLFSPSSKLEGPTLYMDLDVVIKGNIDCFANFGDDETTGVMRDFGQPDTWYNSSILKFNNKTVSYIWDEYDKDPALYQKQQGDQNVITNFVKGKETTKIFPDEWTQSYKWLDRSRTRFHREKWTFEELPSAKVAIFHGSPNPHESVEEWVKKHWQ